MPPPPVIPQPAAPPVAQDPAAAGQFDAAPPFRPQRNLLKLWSWAAGLFAALAAAILLAVSYWGLPDWVPVQGAVFGQAEPDLQLDFPPDQQERRRLPNDVEFFEASGTVTNIGSATRRVPPILIVMRDQRERIVFTWEIAPPQATLAPGESMTIKQANTEVPRSARAVEFGWKPG